jgi:rubredoxin
MWLLFHHSTGAKVVPGGRTLVEDCPTCERRTKFDEIEQTENVGVWFIDVVGDTKRAFRCRVCHDVFDLREPSASAPAPAPAPARDHAAELAASQRRLEDERAKREVDRAAKAVRIEDELAELKKRLGR